MSGKLAALKAAFEAKSRGVEDSQIRVDEKIVEKLAHIKMSHYEHGNGFDYELYECLESLYLKQPELIEHIAYAHNHKGSLNLFFNKTGYKYFVNKSVLSSGLDESWFGVGERNNEIDNIIRFVRDFDCHFLEMYRD